MLRIFASLVLAAATTIVTWTAFASPADALSCQRRIVTRGDSQLRVQQLCGEPSQRSTQVIQRWSSVTVPVVHTTRTQRRGTATNVIPYNQAHTYASSILIERWIYDFGPRRLMRELTFENGTLVRLVARGRGTVAGLAAQREATRARTAARTAPRKVDAIEPRKHVY